MSHLYQQLYLLGEKIPKRDRYGIWQRVENVCVEILELVITAAYKEKQYKQPLLKLARTKIEIMKNILRNCAELKIIEDKDYLFLSEKMITISKMINGWIEYLQP